MAISFVGHAGSSSDNVVPPTHIAGDLLVIYAHNEGSTTPPSLPDGTWNVIAQTGSTSGGTDNALTLAWKIASAPGTSSGVWNNADRIACEVYRGTHQSSPIGAIATPAQGSNTGSITVPGLTGMAAAGSWVAWALCAANRTVTAAPTDVTNSRGAGTSGVHFYDSGSVLTSFSARTATISGSATRDWISFVFEIMAPPTRNPISMII